MEKTLSYIFGDLYLLKHDMSVTAKNFKLQKTVNTCHGLSIMMLAGCVYCAAKHCVNNKQKIEKLEKEIKELKESKGE